MCVITLVSKVVETTIVLNTPRASEVLVFIILALKVVMLARGKSTVIIAKILIAEMLMYRLKSRLSNIKLCKVSNEKLIIKWLKRHLKTIKTKEDQLTKEQHLDRVQLIPLKQLSTIQEIANKIGSFCRFSY